MGLDFSLVDKEEIIFMLKLNVTHNYNLAPMVKETKIWEALWEHKKGEKAKDLIPCLDEGLKSLWRTPELRWLINQFRINHLGSIFATN